LRASTAPRRLRSPGVVEALRWELRLGPCSRRSRERHGRHLGPGGASDSVRISSSFLRVFWCTWFRNVHHEGAGADHRCWPLRRSVSVVTSLRIVVSPLLPHWGWLQGLVQFWVCLPDNAHKVFVRWFGRC
jgi:hypothetical protein